VILIRKPEIILPRIKSSGKYTETLQLTGDIGLIQLLNQDCISLISVAGTNV
jgi:hypothetical protein